MFDLENKYSREEVRLDEDHAFDQTLITVIRQLYTYEGLPVTDHFLYARIANMCEEDLKDFYENLSDEEKKRYQKFVGEKKNQIKEKTKSGVHAIASGMKELFFGKDTYIKINFYDNDKELDLEKVAHTLEFFLLFNAKKHVKTTDNYRKVIKPKLKSLTEFLSANLANVYK